jgi:glycosyltransferase involved in cell wall biosynthesis
MNILIVSCVFLPEPVVSGKSSYSLAHYLTRNKHNVEVLAPYPSRPNKDSYPSKLLKLYHVDKDFKDFKVVRCQSFFSQKSQLLSRFIENISFGLSTSLYLLFSRKYDVIYSNTWPIFASFLITFVAKIKRIPIVTSVQDLYPETLINQGRISNKGGLVNKTLLWIDKYCLAGAYKCVAISEGFKSALIKKGIESHKIEVVYNWDTSDAIKQNFDVKFRDKFNLSDDSILLMYAGNISSSAGVTNLISIFKDIYTINKNSFLCIAGEGSQHNECIKIANINKPNNIFFYYPWKSNETESLLKSADILILPTLDDQALFSVPSKLISYMQSKKPIFTIANKKSDLYSIVTSSNSGWAVESNDARRVLIEAIETPKARLEKYGENAFNYGNQNFNANLNLKKLTTIITNAKKNI